MLRREEQQCDEDDEEEEKTVVADELPHPPAVDRRRSGAGCGGDDNDNRGESDAREHSSVLSLSVVAWWRLVARQARALVRSDDDGDVLAPTTLRARARGAVAIAGGITLAQLAALTLARCTACVLVWGSPSAWPAAALWGLFW